jgi:hypothetical protein
VCVCVCERERERESVCVCVYHQRQQGNLVQDHLVRTATGLAHELSKVSALVYLLCKIIDARWAYVQDSFQSQILQSFIYGDLA